MNEYPGSLLEQHEQEIGDYEVLLTILTRYGGQYIGSFYRDIPCGEGIVLLDDGEVNNNRR
jgi:hypothetical protein